MEGLGTPPTTSLACELRRGKVTVSFKASKIDRLRAERRQEGAEPQDINAGAILISRIGFWRFHLIVI